MFFRSSDSTSAATPRYCELCGELEHGTAACSKVVLVNRGMDDVAAGRYSPLEIVKQRWPATKEAK